MESLPLVVEAVMKAMTMENCTNRITQLNMIVEVVCTFMPNHNCQHLFTTMVNIVVVVIIVDENMVGMVIDIMSVAMDVDRAFPIDSNTDNIFYRNYTKDEHLYFR